MERKSAVNDEIILYFDVLGEIKDMIILPMAMYKRTFYIILSK